MSVYSGFATRQQETFYNRLLQKMLVLLTQRIQTTLIDPSAFDEHHWLKSLRKVYRVMRMMEKNKYLEPKFTTTVKELIEFLSDEMDMTKSHISTTLTDISLTNNIEALIPSTFKSSSLAKPRTAGDRRYLDTTLPLTASHIVYNGSGSARNNGNPITTTTTTNGGSTGANSTGGNEQPLISIKESKNEEYGGNNKFRRKKYIPIKPKARSSSITPQKDKPFLSQTMNEMLSRAVPSDISNASGTRGGGGLIADTNGFAAYKEKEKKQIPLTKTDIYKRSRRDKTPLRRNKWNDATDFSTPSSPGVGPMLAQRPRSLYNKVTWPTKGGQKGRKYSKPQHVHQLKKINWPNFCFEATVLNTTDLGMKSDKGNSRPHL